MTCSACGEKPKKDNSFTKAVVEIDNPGCITLMRKVVVPASMGDDTTVPPAIGKYKNVLLYYEANSKSYLYSSDGIPTQLVNGVTDYEAAVNLPQINGVTLLGDKSAADLGLADAPMIITVAEGNVSWSGADTAEDVYNFFLNKGKVNIVFEGGENYAYEIDSAGYIPEEEKLMCTLSVATMATVEETTEFDGNALFGTMTLYTADKAIDVSQIELQPKLYVADFTGLDLNYNELSGVPATNASIGMVKPGESLEVDENGVLSIKNIEQYATAFDTVSDMVADTSLSDGTFVKTIGYETKNDGYGGSYFISETTGDGAIQLDNGLYAVPVKDSIVKFHAISASSATYIVELPNGKNIIIDTGTSGEWNSIKAALDANDWKFDYGIITHFHVDHMGNLDNILASYVNPGSTWWVQMKPDYDNHSSDIVDSEQRYDDAIQIFTDHGITPIVPANDSYVPITEDVTLHFLNTSTAWAEDYYGQIAEWHEDENGINFNFFSLVTEIIHGKNRILSTGDIERAVEEKVYPYLHKCSIMTAPHHLTNRDGSLPFYQTTRPDFVFAMHQSPTFTWLKNWFKPYIYLDELNAKIITPAGTIATNGLYTLISNGYVSSSMTLSNGNWEDYDKQKLVGYFEQLTNYATQKIATISLKECLENLTPGWVFKGVYYGTFATDFPQVASDIQAIFPFIDTGYQIEMSRPPQNPAQAYIKITSSRSEYVAVTYTLDNSTPTWRSHGNATYQSQISSFADLAAFLAVRPSGHYRLIYQDDEADVLDANTTYQLSIDIQQSLVDDGRLTCSIYAVARIADNTAADPYVASGFINTTSLVSPAHKWRKLV